MADEENIRRCVRDELELNLVQRTRNLIPSAAVSTARDLDQNLAGNLPSNRSRSCSPAFRTPSESSTFSGAASANGAESSSYGGTKRSSSAPGHSWRFKKSKATRIQSIPKTVWLLDKPSEEAEIGTDGEFEDYPISNDMVLLKGEFDLVSNHKEENIRRELEGIFSRKFPGLTMHDFEFVKRDRNIISTPVVKKGHQWDFVHVKHLCGNGRLYVRLVTSRENIEQKDATLATGGDNVVSSPSHASTSFVRFCNVPNSASTSVVPQAANDEIDDEELPQFGAAISLLTTDQKVTRIAAVFPGIPFPVIRSALHPHGSIERAVNSLLSYRMSEGESDPLANPVSGREIADRMTEDTERVKGENCTQVLERLRKKMLPRGMREKLKVDPQDQVMDVYSYYKSADFDALVPISVFVKGQPAVDAGGVLRQVFGEVFVSLCNNEGIKHIFIGEPYRKLPVFSNELVVNGFFEVLGKMISHSLVQGGPGFPYLSPAIYWYLATGDLQTALAKASCADVQNNELSKYIDKISDASDSDLAAITFESEFTQLMCEAGETRVFTPDNKLDVLQSLMLHDILVKRKSILDQFRKGLSTLDVLAEIEHNPSLFEEFFVHQGGLSNDFVLNCLHFQDSCKQNVIDDRVYQVLQTFVKNLSVDELRNFLKFVTGTSEISMSTLPHRISVSCYSGDSIFASTCLLELKLPNHFSNCASFDSAMRTVIEGSSFTTA